MEYIGQNTVYIKLLDNVKKYKLLNPKGFTKAMTYNFDLAKIKIEYVTMDAEKKLNTVCNMLDIVIKLIPKRDYKQRIKNLREEEISVINLRRVIVDINKDLEQVNKELKYKVFKNLANQSILHEAQIGTVTNMNMNNTTNYPHADLSRRTIVNYPVAYSVLMNEPGLYTHSFEVKRTRTKMGRTWKNSRRNKKNTSKKILGSRI